MALKKITERFKKPGKGNAAKAAAFKPAKGPRFVLYIGDEGAILVHINGNSVLSRQFVSDAGEDNLKELASTIAADPKAPLLMVVDSMDQSYIQQTLPPVSSLSVNKLIKRRLDRDFGASDIKGALVLGREKDGRKDWNFLMIALEKSPQLTVWLDFVAALPNRFQGIFLAAVEVETIVKRIDASMGVSSGSEWKFFISHNKVGGFRQVILRNGRIVFTRMAQPVGDSTPEVVAGSIEQEMTSTIEYMRRLSFDDQAGLDIYIVVAGAIKAAIDKSKFTADALHMLTPFEVAQHLHIEGATQPTDQFGDVVLAAGIGSCRKHVLMLLTPVFQKFHRLYQLFLYQRVAAALIVLGIFGYAGTLGYDIYTTYLSASDLEESKIVQQHNLEHLRTEIKNSKLDVDTINDIIDVYQQLLHEKISPLPFIARLEAAVRPPIKVKAIDWSMAAPPSPGGKMTALVTLEFPGTDNAEVYKENSKKLLDSVKAMFKGAEATYTKLPTGFGENEKLDVTFSDKNAPEAPKPIETQMTITGDIIPLPAAVEVK